MSAVTTRAVPLHAPARHNARNAALSGFLGSTLPARDFAALNLRAVQALLALERGTT